MENNAVNSYLKNYLLDVTSCDFDKTLKPAYLVGVRTLPFSDSNFDAVICCELLDYLHINNLLNTLSELSRVSKNYGVISVLYYCIFFLKIMNILFNRLR